MITRIEALHFRCLRHISQALERFHVLVGPNASGKTTFLDVIAFLGRLVSDGLEAAVGERTQNFRDLVWGRSGTAFELAIEVRIPEAIRTQVARGGFDTIRYEIGLGLDPQTGETGFRAETVSLKVERPALRQLTLLDTFPDSVEPPPTILEGTRGRGGDSQIVINKVPGGNDNFYSETYREEGKGWVPAYKLGPRRSALANLPEDETRFPVATWLKELLSGGIEQLVLNSLSIRKASPPGKGLKLQGDGSNLPWVAADLAARHSDRFDEWIAHLRTALPDLRGIRTVEREKDLSRRSSAWCANRAPRHSTLVLHNSGWPGRR
ncbi:MAG: AAA family ATPase [Planctomycetota bacterium]